MILTAPYKLSTIFNNFFVGCAVGFFLAAVPVSVAISQQEDTDHTATFTILTERYNVPHHSAVILGIVVDDAAILYSVPAEILLAQIQIESSYYARAKSHVGAIGLMQVRPQFWAEACAPYDPYDKWENVYVGACALSHYRDTFGNIPDALVAYNIGISAMHRGENLDAGMRYRSIVMQEAATIYSEY